jgi:hypothetical protein
LQNFFETAASAMVAIASETVSPPRRRRFAAASDFSLRRAKNLPLPS